MSLWLAILLLVAAINPPRRRRELPADATVVAAGAGLTLLALLVVGSVGDRVLDTLDISVPTFQVALGLVLLVRGVIDLFVKPSEAGGELPGTKGALAPVFFPVLFRPEVALVAAGIAVEADLAVMLAAALVALLLVVGAVAWLSRFDRALGIAVSMGLIVLAVDRVVDGVFAL